MLVEEAKVFVKDGSTLFLADTYLFDHEVYERNSDNYHLVDSKFVKARGYSKDSSKVKSLDGRTIWEKITLVGAPQRWLTENKYIEQKDERARKPRKA